MKPQRLGRLVLALVILLLFLAPLVSSGIGLLVDFLWFRQEGFGSIYTTILKAQIGVSSLASFGMMALLAINLLIARRISRPHGWRIDGQMIEFPGFERFTGLLRGLVWLSVLFAGYIGGEWASGHWLDYLLARHALLTGQTDPVFGIDVGFYLFRLPFYWFLYHLGLATVVVGTLTVAFFYFVEGGVYATGRAVTMVRAAKAHFMVLGSLLFLLLAGRMRLGMYGLLNSPRGLIHGAGYTDLHATLWALRLALILCLAAALAFLTGARSGRWKMPVIAVATLLVLWIAFGGIYPALMQRFIVAPNEIDKERPYIARAIAFTRQAYALDRFQERHFSAVEDLNLSAIDKNQATVRNIRLWDHRPLLTTFGQLQEIRTYYDFDRVDNDRYRIGGVYRQVSLSPRELAAASLPSRNWINEHLIYTHGYGLCLGPVNESTSDGLPVFFVENIPPAASDPSLRVTRPEIYFGEAPEDYCFVDTRLKEFDYPAGDENVYTSYAGAGGIPVESFWRRLLFTLRLGELKVLLSQDIRSSSRLMIYRNVLARAGRLTPFLRYDHDPYMVVASNGELYWILDGYTIAARYPYAEPFGDDGDNYIRNSVKVTINAYTGRVRFYISDPADPLIRVYSSIFPGVFQPLASMPADLRAHIRYPEDFFSLQAAKYAVYHMTDPRVFYNKEDLWRVARSAAGGAMTPYYTIMKLAEVGTTEEFILMVPFTPARKQNMIAWMAARCDAPNYGKVLVFTFPKQRLVYGPEQIESRIDQDPGISQQLTLWNQGGSKVIRGTLLVIPVLNSVLYVEPLYLTAEGGGALPQLKRVIVSYADKVTMQPTLDDSLASIFGGSVEAAATAAPPTPTALPSSAAPPPSVANLIREANQHYQRAQQLLRQGDWNGYGDEIRKLGQILQQLAQPSAKQ